MNEIRDFLKEKNNKNEQKFQLFHGTNRVFTKHSLEKNRTVLNNKYQGDWICYNDEIELAWKYAESARNQCFDKNVFLEELNIFFSKDVFFGEEVADLMTNLIEKGYDYWDEVFIKYANKNNISEDDSSRIYFENIRILESKLGFNLDDFCEILKDVEYSKIADNEGINKTLNMFSKHIPKIPEESIDFLKKLGFTKSIPETRVLISEITANKVLKTNNREKAKNAKNKGYDLVIYNGEGTVDNKPEYLVLNPEQVDIKEIIVKTTKTIYPFAENGDFSSWREEHSYKNIDLTKKNSKTIKNK